MTQASVDFRTSGKSADELEEIASSLMEMGWCGRCIGRLFARCGKGLDNSVRGEAFIAEYGQEGERPSSEESCSLCRGLFLEVDDLARSVLEELEGIEFDNFLVGTVIDYDTARQEKEIAEMWELECCEPMKGEMNRLIGKLVTAHIDSPVEFERPDVVAIVDSRFGSVTLQISPIFMTGRYRKLVRGIPQTKWFCRTCRGRGCPRCGGTGKMYPESVEELIGAPILRALEGEEHFFHGMGREDIDARMLGNGRPFVLEIRKPRKRSADAKMLERLVSEHGSGKIEVEDLRLTSRSEVAAIKEARPAKSYRARVEFEGAVNTEKLKNVMGCLAGKRIVQKTPSRVVHRRADKYRERTVHAIEGQIIDDHTAVLEIKGEAGMYIKELISGDNNRTVPSVAELAGVPCKVTELDVIYIHDRESADEQEGGTGYASPDKAKEP